MYSHPVYSKEGGWPPIVEEMLAKKSKKEGLPRSRLPAFTEEEKEFIKGVIFSTSRCTPHMVWLVDRN